MERWSWALEGKGQSQASHCSVAASSHLPFGATLPSAVLGLCPEAREAQPGFSRMQQTSHLLSCFSVAGFILGISILVSTVTLSSCIPTQYTRVPVSLLPCQDLSVLPVYMSWTTQMPAWCLQRPEEGIRSPGTVGTDHDQTQIMSCPEAAGNQIHIL